MDVPSTKLEYESLNCNAGSALIHTDRSVFIRESARSQGDKTA
jgi:hypothetical protein